VEKLALAKTLLEIKRKKKAHPPCFVGFDGFTDEIACAVDIRKDPDHFTPIPSIAAFSKRIAKASGKSGNIELVRRETKIGGNGPILANGLIAAGHRVIMAGTIGEKEAEPVFKPLAKKCLKVYLLGPSGHSDAIEFSDGKIILGKHKPLHALTAEKTVKKIGKKELVHALEVSKLFVSANWTMLPMMNDLWEALIKNIIPKLGQKKRYLFVDFADPAKRTDADLKRALKLLQQFNPTYEVILGLNVSEAERIAKLRKISTKSPELMGKKLVESLKLSQIVIHSPKFACTFGEGFSCCEKTPYTPSPALKTGAGDNFNAGYCSGLLYDLSPTESLLLGIAASGFYVRKGKSPALEELAFFLESWHKNRV
jgi:hypothetical protein